MLSQLRLRLATPADAESIAQVVRRAWADRVAPDGAELENWGCCPSTASRGWPTG